MSTDRNILFAVQALALDLIDSSQFIDACEDWAGHKGTSLAEILVKHGSITREQKLEVTGILEQQLDSHDSAADRRRDEHVSGERLVMPRRRSAKKKVE